MQTLVFHPESGGLTSEEVTSFFCAIFFFFRLSASCFAAIALAFLEVDLTFAIVSLCGRIEGYGEE